MQILRTGAALLAMVLGTSCTGDGDKADDTSAPEADADTDSDADTDTDTDTDADTDTDTDSDTDTDTPITEEVDCTDGLDEDEDGLADCADSDCADDLACRENCFDGTDNDLDGLVDCEDDECLETCTEDCANFADDDRDGLTDCDDDECYGQGSCAGPYTLSMVTRFQYSVALWGSDLDQLKYPLDHDFATYLAGRVEVTVEPDGWKGAPAVCRGEIYVVDASPVYSAGLRYVGTSTAPQEFVMAMEPDTADGSLTWAGGGGGGAFSCADIQVPMAYLGFSTTTADVYRQDASGAWYVQYSPAFYEMYRYDRELDIYHRYSERFTQTYPVTWTGSY